MNSGATTVTVVFVLVYPGLSTSVLHLRTSSLSFQMSAGKISGRACEEDVNSREEIDKKPWDIQIELAGDFRGMSLAGFTMCMFILNNQFCIVHAHPRIRCIISG